MRVCVVGAGPCGLTTIKQLVDEGHDVVCFDKNADIGGIWFRYEGDGDQMKAYDNLALTISMKLMAYSDHPFAGGRVFYNRARYLEYLNDYAERYQLRDRVRAGHAVTDIRRAGDGWTVVVRHDGLESRHEFDAVAVCSGPFKTPNRTIGGLEDFTGEIVHSSEYRDNERFRGKRVLIVGLAESGGDIVREIADVAAECTLSIRSYTYLLPRIVDVDRTTDHGTVRAHHHEMYRRATTRPLVPATVWGHSVAAKFLVLLASVVYGCAATVFGALRGIGRRRSAAETGSNPMGEPRHPAKIDIGTLDNAANRNLIRTWNHRSHPQGSWSQRGIFCKNVSFIPAIAEGRVIVNDSGILSAQGDSVLFRDSAVGEFDTVVLCTGFTQDLSLGDLTVTDGNVRNLYKHFLHPEHGGTVAFIGFVRPFSGGIPVCAEMQARYFARVCSGKLQPPTDLDDVIRADREWEEYWTALSPRHTESIPSQILYLDSLAREIGCLVPWWKMVINPKLFVQLWFGSFNPSGYRIVGPHNRGAAALEDLYSEPVANKKDTALRFSLLQLMPSGVHPRDLMGESKAVARLGTHGARIGGSAVVDADAAR
ncbi:flavin-containing monooxygenase [Mycobacterium sp. C31M]